MTLKRNKSGYHYYGNNPAADYLAELRRMGKPIQILTLTPTEGHTCEEIPTCIKRAVVALLFERETVYLCRDMYERWREKNDENKSITQ